MKTFFRKVENSYGIIKKVMDIFYGNSFSLEKAKDYYWHSYLPTEAWEDIKDNFDEISSKNIMKENYKNSGLDEFEYYLTVFLATFSEDYPECWKEYKYKKVDTATKQKNLDKALGTLNR